MKREQFAQIAYDVAEASKSLEFLLELQGKIYEHSSRERPPRGSVSIKYGETYQTVNGFGLTPEETRKVENIILAGIKTRLRDAEAIIRKHIR